jgi:hypothetical protein
MKTLCYCATTLALAGVISLSPAMAQGPKLSGSNAWPGISQPVEHDAVPAHSANRHSGGQTPRPQARRASWTCLLTPKAPR